MKDIDNNIEESCCSFEVSKLLKEKEFDVECLHFYTKPKSKMYGIDEHGRAYPIKNISKKLYTCGQHASSKDDNVYLAPSHAIVIEWLRVNFDIWIKIGKSVELGDLKNFQFDIERDSKKTINSIVHLNMKSFDNPQESTEAAIKYVLEELL